MKNKFWAFIFWAYLIVLFSALMINMLEPNYKVFKCKYYDKDWEFIVTDKGVDIACTD